MRARRHRTPGSWAALGLLLAVMAIGLAGPARAAPGTCANGNRAFNFALTLQQSTASSTVGTTQSLIATVTDANGPVAGVCVDFLKNAGPGTPFPQNATTDKAGRASVTWTSNSAGTDSLTAKATDAQGQVFQATVRHTWTVAPRPSPTPSPSGTRAPTRPPTRPPSPRPTATVAPPASAAPSPTPSPSPSPSAPSPTPSPARATASASPTPPPVSPPPPLGQLQLDQPSSLPGGTTTVRGRNCPPGAPVSFSVEGTAAGTSTAGPDGAFRGVVQLPDTTIGEHRITATCGRVTATATLDLVVSSATSTPGAGATAGAVLVFFVLLGTVLASRARRRTP